MAQVPSQQAQGIRQPVSAAVVQQQMLFPGTLTLQQTGMSGPTLQSIGAAQGLSLQLQAKPSLDNRSGNVQQVTNKVQVVPQHLSAPYFQHLYPQQILYPGTLTLHNGQVIGQTLQSFGSTPGLSFHLQTRPLLDNRARNVQNIQFVTNKVGSGTQTVAGTTQTIVSSIATVNSSTEATPTQVSSGTQTVVGTTQTIVSSIAAVNSSNEATPTQVCSGTQTVAGTTHTLVSSTATISSSTEATPTQNEHLKPPEPIVKPSLEQVKDKAPQKAIVKPQVLPHVTDGLSQEEPFPVKSAQKRKAAEVSPEKKSKVYRGRGRGRRRRMRGRRGRPKRVQVEVTEVINIEDDSSTLSNETEDTSIEMQTDSPDLPPVSSEKEVEMQEIELVPLSPRLPTKRSLLVEKNEDINTAAKEADSVDKCSTISNAIENVNSAMHIDNLNLPSTSKKEVELKEIESDLPSQKLPIEWSVQEVCEFIKNTPGCAKYADTFQSQEIDGQSLLLLKHNHLMTSMNMKLGPALKLMEQIDIIKEKFGLTEI